MCVYIYNVIVTYDINYIPQLSRLCAYRCSLT